VILTVALDATFDDRAVGRGITVARVLHTLGRDTMVTGLVDADTGPMIRADVVAAGLRESLFDLAGPSLSISDWADFVGGYHTLAARASVVVLSGSLRGKLPDDAYAQLIRTTPTPTILDTSGGPLLAGLAARPAVVTPNAAELAEATGLTDPEKAARVLLERGAGAVVASLGEEGLLAVSDKGSWRARVTETLHGNPAGAGAARVAALAAGHALDWPERLAEAVAVSAAAVPGPPAGDIDPDTYARLRPAITVEDLDAHADR